MSIYDSTPFEVVAINIRKCGWIHFKAALTRSPLSPFGPPGPWNKLKSIRVYQKIILYITQVNEREKIVKLIHVVFSTRCTCQELLTWSRKFIKLKHRHLYKCRKMSGKILRWKTRMHYFIWRMGRWVLCLNALLCKKEIIKTSKMLA